MTSPTASIELACAERMTARFVPSVHGYQSSYALVPEAQPYEEERIGKRVALPTTTESFNALVEEGGGAPIRSQADALALAQIGREQRLAAEHALIVQAESAGLHTQVTAAELRSRMDYYGLDSNGGVFNLQPTATLVDDHDGRSLLITPLTSAEPVDAPVWRRAAEPDVMVTDLTGLAAHDDAFVASQLREIHHATMLEWFAERVYLDIAAHEAQPHTPGVLQELGALTASQRAAANFVLRQVASLPIDTASDWRGTTWRFTDQLTAAYRKAAPPINGGLARDLDHRANCEAAGVPAMKQATGEYEAYQYLDELRLQQAYTDIVLPPQVLNVLEAPSSTINNLLPNRYRDTELQAYQEATRRQLTFMQTVLEAPAETTHCLLAIEAHLPEAYALLVRLREQCGEDAFADFLDRASQAYAIASWPNDPVRKRNDQMGQFRSAFRRLTEGHESALTLPAEVDINSPYPYEPDFYYALYRLVDVHRLEKAEAGPQHLWQQRMDPRDCDFLRTDLRSQLRELQERIDHQPVAEDYLAARRRNLVAFQRAANVSDADLAAYAAMNQETNYANHAQLAMLGALVLTRLGRINPDQPGVKSLLSAVYDPEAEHREAIDTMWQRIVAPVAP